MNFPIDKNRRWISSLHGSIDRLHEDLKAAVMKPVGTDCASDLMSLCESHLGKRPATVQDLIDGWNNIRNARGLKGQWEIENGTVRGIFYECGCPLVRSGLIELHPIQCFCSQGMLEAVFSKVSRTKVEVFIKRSIGRGDDACEFMILER